MGLKLKTIDFGHRLAAILRRIVKSNQQLSEIDALEKMSRVFVDKMLQSEAASKQAYFVSEIEKHKHLRVAIDAAVADIVSKLGHIQIRNHTKVISYQIGIIAAYIRTHHVLSSTIHNGNLLDAIILIRKQMELLARFKELDHLPLRQLVGKTPNIKWLKLQDSGKAYGFYSRYAHFSDPSATEMLGVTVGSDESIGSPHIFPVFHENAYEFFLTQSVLNIYFISAVLNKLTKWDPDLDDSGIMTFGSRATMLATELEILEVSDK